MTDLPNEPDWSLLPHDPVRFFGLPTGFDRRDLKRRYNQLIRRFKPERHPQEFQRIRAAFEQLDSGIRYGLSTNWSAPAADEYQWSDDSQQATPSAEPKPATPAKAVPTIVPLHERLQCENAADIYKELSAKTAKTAFDYYVLAVMSDVVDRKDGLQFARWLLQGLAARKKEIGLMRLLHAYLRGPIDDAACEKLLVACSKVVHEDAFFLLTEPLWRTLVKSSNFTRFRQALQDCEANLQGISIDGRIAFYLQMLKSALWVADEAWIEESLDFIEENFERIPAFLDFDVEIVTRLRAYIRHRQAFAGGHSLLQRMDQSLRDYFTEDQEVGDRSMLATQVQIMQDLESLTAAFGKFDDPAYGPFYAIWAWVSHDVAERNIESAQPEADDNIWFARTRTLLEQIARQTDNSRFGVAWVASTITYRCIQLACYAVPIIIVIAGYGVITDAASARKNTAQVAPVIEVTTLLLLIVAGIAGHMLKNLIKKRAWFPFCRWLSARSYRRLWQPEILGFLARSHVPYRTLVMYIAHPSFATISKADWVKLYVGQDFALPVFSLAQRFVV